MRFDLLIFSAVNGLTKRSRLLDRVGFFFAHVLTFILGGLAFLFALFADGGLQGPAALLGMLAAFILGRGVLATAIQHLVRRERPYVLLKIDPQFSPVTRWSMPSGHMSALFAMGAFMLFVSPAWGVAYLAASVLVGAGRIFCGLHWPSDILAGAALGFLSGWIVFVSMPFFA